MVGLISALQCEERRKNKNGESDFCIPMRPDHGHLMGDEADNPDVKLGYSYAGRMKGLAKLRGVIHTLEKIACCRFVNISCAICVTLKA